MIMNENLKTSSSSDEKNKYTTEKLDENFELKDEGEQRVSNESVFF